MAVATFRKASAHTGAEGTITINIESGSSMRIYQWDAGSCSGIYWTAVGFS
nr:MAG TPA: SprB repeat [Caudoviricetes sp.]